MTASLSKCGWSFRPSLLDLIYRKKRKDSKFPFLLLCRFYTTNHAVGSSAKDISTSSFPLLGCLLSLEASLITVCLLSPLFFASTLRSKCEFRGLQEETGSSAQILCTSPTAREKQSCHPPALFDPLCACSVRGPAGHHGCQPREGASSPGKRLIFPVCSLPSLGPLTRIFCSTLSLANS